MPARASSLSASLTPIERSRRSRRSSAATSSASDRVGVLDDAYVEAFLLQDCVDPLPAGSIYEAAVNEDIAKAVAVGATLTSAAHQRDFGIYSGYFADPEGNSWEIAWAPSMPMSASGELLLNP